MGRVYLAFTPGGRPVALKVVRPEYGDDEDFRARFRQEIEAARQVHGLYTAQVLDAGPDAVPPWLVTAYVPGPSLAQAVREYGPMPVGTVLLLMAGVAEALQAIHAAGVVHRDLKPSNVLLAPDGPRVIDFGIAWAVEATAVTRPGTRVGSPQFMAPEQIAGRAATPAIDVFALGSLATFTVLGRPPFGEGGDASAVLYRILHEPPDLSGCPEPLRALLGRCLAKDPAERPEPGEIISLCRRYTAGQTVQIAQSWLPAGLAALLAEHAASPAPDPPPAAAPAGVAPPSRAPTAYPPPPGAAAAYPPPPQAAAAAFQPPPRPGAGPARTWFLQPDDAPRRRRPSRAALIGGAGAGAVTIALAVVLAILLIPRGPAGSNGGPANGTNGHDPRVGVSGEPTSPAGRRNGESSSATPQPTLAPPQPTLAPNLDRCMIGTWKGDYESVTFSFSGKPVTFIGRGATQTFWPDGTGKADYGNRMVYRGKLNGNLLEEVATGYATFYWTAKNGVERVYHIRSHGTVQLLENGVLNNSGPTTVAAGLLNYTCSRKSLVFFAKHGTDTLTRELPNPQSGG
jgi:hypothetical protein